MISYFGPRVKNELVSFDESAQHTTQHVMTRPKLYYFHSFGNTERYFVTIEMPMYLSFWKLIVSGAANKSFYECFEWDRAAANIFHIFDRQTGALTIIDSTLQFFYFHTINTYDEDGKLVIELCGYDNNKIIDDFYLATMTTTGISEEHKSSLRRITLDLVQSAATMENLNVNFECQILTLLTQARGTVMRMVTVNGCRMLSDSIAKYDFEKRQQTIWKEKHLIPGEPIFYSHTKRETRG